MKIIIALTLVFLLPACATNGSGAAKAASCPSGLSAEQELKIGMIREDVEAGKLYAALASLETLPISSPQVVRQKADISRRIGRNDAKGLYEALQKTCLSGYGDHGLGLLAAGDGNYQQAEKWLSRAVTKLPTDARMRNDLGISYIYNGKDTDARFELMTAVELDSGSSRPVINLLSLFLLNGSQKSLDDLSGRFPITAEQLADAMQICLDINGYRNARKTDSGSDEESLKGEGMACNWKTVSDVPRLASLFRTQKPM